MNPDWEVHPLGEVCDLSIGRTPSRSDPTLWDADRQTRNVWVSIADLGNAEAGIVSDSREYVSNQGAALGRVVPAGTLLLSFKLSLGKLAFAGCDLQTNEAIAALPIRKGVALLDRFLFWYLQSVSWDSVAGADSKVKGRTLNKKTLGALLVPIPPLAEQERIVRILDSSLARIDLMRRSAETAASLARSLAANFLQRVVAGEDEHSVPVLLGDDCELLPGFAFPSREFRDGPPGTRLLRGDNVAPGCLRWKDAKWWPTEEAEEFTKFQVEPGDIVLGMDRPWIASGLRIAKLGLEDCPALLVQRVLRLRFGNSWDRRFAYLRLQCGDFRVSRHECGSGWSWFVG